MNYWLGVLGAAVGGTIGYFVFRWCLSKGFYAMVVPGALLGVGCGLLSGIRSYPLGALCAVAGLALSLFSQWRLLPFAEDGSLSFLLLHLFSDTPTVQLLMIALGAFAAFWFGVGRTGGVWKVTKSPDSPE
jgi:hypothetical protein